MSAFGKAAALFIPRKTQDPVAQPGYGTDMRAIEAWAEKVIVQLVAGSNITLTPSSGTGPVVEIAASGGGGGYASLTGPGQTVTPGALTQAGELTITNSFGVALNVAGGVAVDDNTQGITLQSIKNGANGIVLEAPSFSAPTNSMTFSYTTGIDIEGGGVVIDSSDGNPLDLQYGGTTVVRVGNHGGGTPGLGFWGDSISLKPAVSGSRGGNVALANLLTALAGYGLITDSTTP